MTCNGAMVATACTCSTSWTTQRRVTSRAERCDIMRTFDIDRSLSKESHSLRLGRATCGDRQFYSRLLSAWRRRVLALTFPHFTRQSSRRIVSVALSVRSVTAFRSREYDRDVTIRLTERLSNGRTIFIDHGNHDARVKCLPGKVFVGGKEYLPLPSQATLDWKEDLVESLCTRQVS
ncbi:hypothetical protein FHT76_007671 [Rhizobium sp. BK176]|nr:hypothetical protein [Rhizobium sp. BK399]MCS3743856.1 hypothetical protein [Rhizobium sp. BK661]MCS4095950.1 hypothetical protein [Rhizobium sp. BK176]